MEQTFNHCSFPNPASPASLLRPAHIHIQLELTHSLSSLPAGAGYPYVFLNDEPFSQEFKKYTQELTSAECFYGLIEPSHWNQPDWIDEEKATAARNDMIEKKVIYGHSVPYRNSQSGRRSGAVGETGARADLFPSRLRRSRLQCVGSTRW